jgi:hypothetical protein
MQMRESGVRHGADPRIDAVDGAGMCGQDGVGQVTASASVNCSAEQRQNPDSNIRPTADMAVTKPSNMRGEASSINPVSGACVLVSSHMGSRRSGNASSGDRGRLDHKSQTLCTRRTKQRTGRL